MNPLGLIFTFCFKVRGRLQRLWGRFVLASTRASVGPGVMCWGAPIISMERDSSIVLGENVVLCSLSSHTALGVNHPVVLRTLWPGAKLVLGKDTGVSGATICAAREVVIGERCLFGANVQIVDTDFHPIAVENRRFEVRESRIAASPVRIGNDVFLGANTWVLKGVTIGDGSVVGAGSVVTRSIPPGCIAAGNPAKVIGTVPTDPEAAAALRSSRQGA